MDENSLRELAKKKYKLYLGFTTITLSALDPKLKDAEDNPAFSNIFEVEDIIVALIQKFLISENRVIY